MRTRLLLPAATLSLTAFIVSMAVAQANFTAKLYEQGSKKEKLLFTQEAITTFADGLEMLKMTYKDPAGNVIIDQTTTLKDGEIVRDEIDQKQINEKGLIEVEGDQIKFTKTASGKTTTETEKKKSTFVISANFGRFVHSKWADIMAGKTVEFRYGVWRRQETVGFEVKKTGTGQHEGTDYVTIVMKPSSFVIAAIVDPIDFKFSTDGSKLFYMNGRVPPMKQKGEKWTDLDAEVYYADLIAATTTTSPVKPAKKRK